MLASRSSRVSSVLLDVGRRFSGWPSSTRAVVAHEYGGIDQLRVSRSWRPPAVSDPSEVLVRVHAASVNPMDVALLSGYGSRAFAPIRRLAALRGDPAAEFPFVLGRDFSGEVLATGKAVKDLRRGDAVFGAVWPFSSGTMTDVVCVRAAEVALKPASWDHVQAASVPYAGLTAFSALTQLGWQRPEALRGRAVLVHGASGGVGSLAVQLAAAWGAFVVATVREANLDFGLQLGANSVVALTPDSDLLPEVTALSPDGAGFDLVLDCVGLELMAKALRSGQLARYVTLRSDLVRQMDDLGPLGAASAALGLLQKNWAELGHSQRLLSWGFFRPSAEHLRRITLMAEKGQIRPFVDSVFPLEEAAEAFRKLQKGGVKGKVVVSLK